MLNAFLFQFSLFSCFLPVRAFLSYLPLRTCYIRICHIRICRLIKLITQMSRSSSCNMSSSASNHNPSTKYDTIDSESTSSDSSSTNNDTPNTSAKSVQRIKIYKRPLVELTQENLAQHERRFVSMSSFDRVEYWDLAEVCSELEDDFDDTTYYTKPVRSERVSLYFHFLSHLHFSLHHSPIF